MPLSLLSGLLVLLSMVAPPAPFAWSVVWWFARTAFQTREACWRRRTPTPVFRAPRSRGILETRMSPFIEREAAWLVREASGPRDERVEAARSQVDSKSRSLRSQGARSP